MLSIAVIGAGFSGIGLCHHLIKCGIKPEIFDAQLPEKASSVPLGLVNPTSGQKGIPAWEYAEGMKAAYELLNELQEFTYHPIYKKNGIIRSAMSEEMAQLFIKNAASYTDKSVEFISDAVYKKEFPSVFGDFGGLVIPEGGTVSGQYFTQAFANYFRKMGGTLHRDKIKSICKNGEGWLIKTIESSFTFDKVVVCTGAIYPQINEMDISPLIHPVKGQLTRIRFENIGDLPEESVSGLGYLARLNDEFVFGSTFEHQFSTIEPTESGAKRLAEDFEKLFPKFKHTYSFGRQWTGLRASTPDRKPLIGEFAEYPGLLFSLGCGSKGQIWANLLGKYLTDYLLKNIPLPKEADIKRFAKRIHFN